MSLVSITVFEDCLDKKNADMNMTLVSIYAIIDEFSGQN